MEQEEVTGMEEEVALAEPEEEVAGEEDVVVEEDVVGVEGAEEGGVGTTIIIIIKLTII